MRTPIRVLLVEDSTIDATLMLQELRRGGYEPVAERVETEEAMRKALGRQTWDLVLADYALPNFSAPNALAALKDTGLDVPFIVVSGAVGEETAAAVTRAGAHDYVMKDRLERLAPAVRRELADAEARRRHRAAEAALRESEERFRTAFEDAPVGMCLTAPGGRFLRVNQAFADFLGYAPRELRGKHFLDVTHPDDRPPSIERFRQTLDGATDRFSLEKRYMRRDGAVVWGIVSTRLLRGEQARPALFITHLLDITRRKEAEEALHQLPSRLLEAQEAERRRIAKELHDSTAQELTAAIMELAVLRRQTGSLEGPAKATLADLHALLESSARGVRTLSHLLHPPMMDELSIAEALHHYVAGFSQRSGILVVMEVPDAALLLTSEARVALFRIVQEALSNIHRHSGSKTARVRLAREGAEAVLEVADDGRGIPTPSGGGPQVLPGVGLASMRERAHHLGGRLEIHSGTTGTLVRAFVPLAKEPDA